MFPLGTNGNTDASTTRSPSSPRTRIVSGSTTASSSVPIRHVQDGCSAVSASRATHSRISSSVTTAGPGDSSPANDPAAPGDSPSEMLMRKEQELLVADALARLSPDHREVILLRNLQRLPFQEVAERMGRSRPAVQMLWMRAIGKLQEELAGGDLSGIFA